MLANLQAGTVPRNKQSGLEHAAPATAAILMANEAAQASDTQQHYTIALHSRIDPEPELEVVLGDLVCVTH